MKIALISWSDAHFVSGGSVTKEKLSNDMFLFSAGILVDDNPDAIKIAMDFTPESNDYREAQVIPREYILHYITLDVDITFGNMKKLRQAIKMVQTTKKG